MKICLITPGHVSSTPRLVKEADALAEAGYSVSVVAARHFAPVDALDEAVVSRSRWDCHRVDAVSRARVLPSKVARKLAQTWVTRRARPGIRMAALAEDAVTLRLVGPAVSQKADLYVGHCLGGLAAAALAARANRVPFGFDIEDYHDGETEGAMGRAYLVKAAKVLQSTLLGEARYLTSAAPLISERYRDIYGVASACVLNVFPLSEAPAAPVAPHPISSDAPAVLYWFSQTVGADRGLEEMLAVIAKMKTPARLHLRGFVSEAYRNTLTRLAAELGVRHPPSFLPPAEPQEMVRLSAAAHAGICMEKPVVPNRDICLTNKIFTYLLAGIPALLSPTSAHRALAPDLGDCARVLPLAEPERAARVVDDLLGLPNSLAAARTLAWRLGHERYCWDIEKNRVLDLVASALRATP